MNSEIQDSVARELRHGHLVNATWVTFLRHALRHIFRDAAAATIAWQYCVPTLRNYAGDLKFFN